MKEWIVPMRWTRKGYATVEAGSAEEAIEKANRGSAELHDTTAETVDWEVTGKPKEA